VTVTVANDGFNISSIAGSAVDKVLPSTAGAVSEVVVGVRGIGSVIVGWCAGVLEHVGQLL
jgi:hypothetical protein